MREILGRHLVVEIKTAGVKTTLDLMTDERQESSIYLAG